MEKKQNKTENIRVKRPQLYVKGQSGNIKGRPKETEEKKIIRKATKEIINEYKERLADALPLISPILIALSLEGDIQAIKEIHDRVMGKAPQDINLSGEVVMPFKIIIENPNGGNKQLSNGTENKDVPETI